LKGSTWKRQFTCFWIAVIIGSLQRIQEVDSIINWALWDRFEIVEQSF